jgi:PAS domain S-box-containing protein
MNNPASYSGGGSVRLQREVSLPPELTSAGEARRVLRAVLCQAGREQWLDAAELAVSEVVTNATLHAHTPIELRIGVFEDEVCVEVRDYNPALPHQRSYDEEATTGRGMKLVAAVARSYGVQPLGADGKVIWFCVGDLQVAADADALLEMWDIDIAPVATSENCVEVVLRGIPATLWLSARQHHDAILRELVLYLAEHPRIDVDVASADRARAIVSNALVAAVEEAQARGTAQPPLPGWHPSPLPPVPLELDLTVSVPQDIGPSFAVLQDVLDLAEALAVEEVLFTRPALPEIVAVRDWACEQVIAQLAGSSPAAWLGTDQERFERDFQEHMTPALPDWDTSAVTTATTGVIAADDANRIIAVSAPLAALLGWEPAELVGRRVVTVIPPALREAHVAGFSRHLSTGEAHVLGVPLELPVLCKDGSEVRCRFLIERAPLGKGRAVYLAWIDSVDTEGVFATDGEAT